MQEEERVRAAKKRDGGGVIVFPPHSNADGEGGGRRGDEQPEAGHPEGVLEGDTSEGGDLSFFRDRCTDRHRGWPTDKQADLDRVTQAIHHGTTTLPDSSGAPHGDTTVHNTDFMDSMSDMRNIGPDRAPQVGEYVNSERDNGSSENRGEHSRDTEQYRSMADLDPEAVKGTNQELKRIFDQVASLKRFNYDGARIPLPSELNIREWRTMLRGYHDFGIVEYLEFGWPIGIDRDAPLKSDSNNHASAIRYPADVEHYVVTELSHKALLGPFAGPPATSCHYSPLMSRPKKGSLFRRVIIDLSWPRGLSVNDAISKTNYIDGPLTISLPTHDDMERAVIRAGRGAFLYKTDLSRGYRQLRIDPIDWPYLSFQHKGAHFMDICPPFGLRSSAMAMQRVSQAIVYLHGRRGFLSRAYIDDFGGVEGSHARDDDALSELQGIMGTLGVQQAEHKICLPAQVMIWLGIRFDSLAMSMEIPRDKMEEIMVSLEAWSGKIRATRKEIQSLLGLLNFVASVAPPARLFTNRMLDDLRETPPVGATSLSHQFKLDVRFFQELLPIFNGRKIMAKQLLPYQHQVELDACLTGCGAIAGDQFYANPFPPGVVEAGHTIAHLELLNIVVAVKVWRERWAGWVVQIFCDNMNSVHVLQSGRSRDLFMRECAKEIFLHTAACDIELQICHRPGVSMIWADALSREHTGPAYAQFVRQDPHLQAATRITVPQEYFRVDNRL